MPFCATAECFGYVKFDPCQGRGDTGAGNSPQACGLRLCEIQPLSRLSIERKRKNAERKNVKTKRDPERVEF
ncbi:MAG TPA: hypothetical protein PKY81_08065 [bacterium]|nr:hypothetical protein [bacterium]HPN30898.1 hypothetical protein [bacterium]